MAPQNDGVRVNRSTVALILEIMVLVSAVGVAGYQIRESQAINREQQTRLDAMTVKMAEMSKDIATLDMQSRAQAQVLAENRKEVRELERQVDRDRRFDR